MALNAVVRIGGALCASALVIGALSPAVSATARPQAVPVSSATVSGYGFEGSLLSVGATFKVPSVTCSSIANDGNYGAEFGIAMYGADSSASYPDTEAVVLIQCVNYTSAPYYAFELLAGNGSFGATDVSPGDTIVASIWQSATDVEARVHDVTNGVNWAAAGAAEGDPAASVGTFPVFSNLNLAQVPPAKFTTTKFTNVNVNGDNLGFAPELAELTLEGLNGPKPDIAPGALTSNESSFQLVYKASD